MLKKSHRLNLKNSFKWVASGKKIDTPFFKLFIKLGENETPLIGIASAKAQFRKAHDRNRARRLTSEALQTLYPTLRNNLNLVIMPKLKVLESSLEDILKDLKNVQDIYLRN